MNYFVAPAIIANENNVNDNATMLTMRPIIARFLVELSFDFNARTPKIVPIGANTIANTSQLVIPQTILATANPLSP